MPRDRERDAVEPEEAPPAPLTRPEEEPASGKSAESILAAIFSPVPEAGPLEQLERASAHPKQLVREAIKNLVAPCDEVWVFGPMSLGVKVQLGIAKRLKKPLRFYDIADLPEQVYRISEKLAQEEGRDCASRCV